MLESKRQQIEQIIKDIDETVAEETITSAKMIILDRLKYSRILFLSGDTANIFLNRLNYKNLTATGTAIMANIIGPGIPPYDTILIRSISGKNKVSHGNQLVILAHEYLHIVQSRTMGLDIFKTYMKEATIRDIKIELPVYSYLIDIFSKFLKNQDTKWLLFILSNPAGLFYMDD